MSGVFVLDRDNKLHELAERAPDSEDYLQTLLAEFPRLIPGELIDSESPRRWLFVTRELPVADSSESNGRWWVDHLFIDQDSIPTIVEVKRSSDTRIRREVIGQILEYAANAVAYCPVERLQGAFEERCERDGRTPDDALQAVFGAGFDCAGFWSRVNTNLRAGRVRLILLADQIPTEVRRIVEFLNEQMSQTELLAVEIKLYGDAQGLRTLVPRVYGHSQQAAQAKNPGSRERRRWDKESVLADADSRFTGHERDVAHRTMAWAENQPVEITYGAGVQSGSFGVWYPTASGGTQKGTPLFNVYTDGHFEICFQYWNRMPFADTEKRLAVVDRLNEIASIRIPRDAINRRPSIVFGRLTPEVLAQVLVVFEWVIAELCSPVALNGQ
jgi:hypothetical protein